MKKAVIILPTYNEKENIKNLIPTIFKITANLKNWQVFVLVVDDRSPDNTIHTVEKLQKQFTNLYITQGKKQGLGAAYSRGFSYVLKNINPEVIFEMDADWSHDPLLIPSFLEEIEKGADFVIGSRYIKGGSIPKNWEIHRKIFSVLGNQIIRIGFMALKISDWTSGYRAIKAWFLKEILTQMKNYNGYVFQVALLDKAKKRGLKIAEIPLMFKDRKKGKSKIDSMRYILNTLFYVFLNSSFIKFVIVGTCGFIIDFAISFVLIEKIHWLIWSSTILSSETAVIFNFFINNFWSFSHKKIEKKISSYFIKLIHFNFISLGSIFIQTIFLHLTTIIFPKKWWFIYKALIIIFLIIPYSYFMYNRIIWKKIRNQ